MRPTSPFWPGRRAKTIAPSSWARLRFQDKTFVIWIPFIDVASPAPGSIRRQNENGQYRV